MSRNSILCVAVHHSISFLALPREKSWNVLSLYLAPRVQFALIFDAPKLVFAPSISVFLTESLVSMIYPTSQAIDSARWNKANIFGAARVHCVHFA